MNAPPIHYTRTSDGARIAYQTIGSGPPLLVFPAGPFADRLYDWSWPPYREAWRQLAEHFTVALFDLRGSGQSVRGGMTQTIQAGRLDALAVAGALGWERFDIAMGNLGAPLGLHFAATEAERVQHCMVWNGISALSALPGLSAVLRLASNHWELFLATMVRTVFGYEGQAANDYLAMLNMTIDFDEFSRNVEIILAWDATALLPQVSARTLVLANRTNRPINEQFSRAIAQAIPNAELQIVLSEPEGPGDLPDIMRRLVTWRFGNRQPERNSLATCARCRYTNSE